MDDTKRIESSKLAFVEAMEKTDNVLKPEKVQLLVGLMDKAMKGVRRIAALFNRKKENEKSSVRVGKSCVHRILTAVGLTEKQKTAANPNHLHRPQKQLSSFNMDLLKGELEVARLHMLLVCLICIIVVL